jgi:hypothetical protein
MLIDIYGRKYRKLPLSGKRSRNSSGSVVLAKNSRVSEINRQYIYKTMEPDLRETTPLPERHGLSKQVVS